MDFGGKFIPFICEAAHGTYYHYGLGGDVQSGANVTSNLVNAVYSGDGGAAIFLHNKSRGHDRFSLGIVHRKSLSYKIQIGMMKAMRLV
jgi:hypothetical protein